ncbi:hypothetical protein ES677_01955 [Bizionia gelidisalsuginis]|uniref:DUF4179 domain-containing protein n=1 Tax=Bizionia gelidisalsuginis TaxID=291188 RepID=A0ABY3MF05_9FLAO|nr:hypothetical protein [Bizionia gelidisalsuginis]TYC18167.1 hypothetical protein ES677_01955 [Bizionia gelidisalsuginis]
MKNDNIETLFKDLHQDFNVETPNTGHHARFLEKLDTQNALGALPISTSKRELWKPITAIAATIVLLVALTLTLKPNNPVHDLANVSPEMANTQTFFTSVINEKLNTINNAKSPETTLLIKDAMVQMEILEKEYNQLKIDLTESGNDKRVIHAMINNFWNRINLLKEVVDTIEGLKTINYNTDEITL